MAVFLTDRQKQEMLVRWDTGRYTQQELANWYGCSHQYISKIIALRASLEPGPEGEEPVAIFDALAMKNVEDCLGAIAAKIAHIIEKTPEKIDNLPLLNRSGKFVLEIRRQLKELPKDIHRPPVVMSPETIDKLAGLIPTEKREEFVTLMRTLARPQGQPESDLAEE